jgi:hypothetical protein
MAQGMRFTMLIGRPAVSSGHPHHPQWFVRNRNPQDQVARHAHRVPSDNRCRQGLLRDHKNHQSSATWSDTLTSARTAGLTAKIQQRTIAIMAEPKAACGDVTKDCSLSPGATLGPRFFLQSQLVLPLQI